MPAIEFLAARYAIDGRAIVGPLDLEVRRGETLVFLGESGSGKTTSLRLVNRLPPAAMSRWTAAAPVRGTRFDSGAASAT